MQVDSTLDVADQILSSAVMRSGVPSIRRLELVPRVRWRDSQRVHLECPPHYSIERLVVNVAALVDEETAHLKTTVRIWL